MDCIFQLTLQNAGNGKNLFICTVCGSPILAPTDDPGKIKRKCNAAPVYTTPCVHLGASITQKLAAIWEQETGSPCAKQSRVEEFECAEHGRATVALKKCGVQCCRGCADYKPT